MPIQVYYNIVDGKGKTSLVAIDIPTNTSATNAVAFCHTMAPLVKALTNGGLQSAGVRLDISPAGWSSAANAIADVEEKALFSFKTAIGGFLKKISIPTFLETLFTPASKVVDTAADEVLAFVSAMVDGLDVSGNGGTGTIQPVTSHNEDLASLVNAVELWG